MYDEAIGWAVFDNTKFPFGISGGGGRIVAFTPNAPNPWSGRVYILAPEHAQSLDLSMADYMENVERFGQGTNELLNTRVESSGPNKGAQP